MQVIISEKNLNGLLELYGECTADELNRIVNNIIDNAIVEIHEDIDK